MKRFFLLFFLGLSGYFCQAQSLFQDYFDMKSLRIDFALSGDYHSQSAALQQLREEPIWGGPIYNLIDTFFYGGYYVNIYEETEKKLIYSRGFNTLFEEWRSTDQAKVEIQSWTNSISVPYPKVPVLLEISARDRQQQWVSLLKIPLDPASIFVDRGNLKENIVYQIQYKGNPSHKVDLVFLAEGYTSDEQEKFVQDVERFTEYLFQTPPFDSRREDFNIWSVGLVSEDSGTDISGEGIFKNTVLNSGYYTFGVDRYLTTRDMKSVRDAVWNVPCDAIYILVNTNTYGGGGMYNFYAMGTSDNERTLSVFAHEFGHSFAGLADEYYSSEVAYNDFYNLNIEPWEPNITTLINFDRKWKDLLSPEFPIPTPVDETYRESIGVFEGGGYMAKGIYRPMDHCMMRDFAPFCPVCSRAIHQMIDFLTDKPD